MSSTLSKMEVSKRQLVTAIRLFFEGGDPVSVFTLAANAWEIIDELCNKAGIDSISNQTRGHVLESKDLKRDYINSPYRNYFKHADRDPDAVLKDFDERKCDGVILLAVEDYLRLNLKAPVEFQVFQLWYLALNIEKVSDNHLNRILASTNELFPNINNIKRKEQLELGRKAMEDYKDDSVLLQDGRTETSL